MRTLALALLVPALLAPALLGPALLAPAAPPGLAPPAGLALSAPPADDAAARALVRALPRATLANDADGDKLWDSLEARFALAPGQRVGVVTTWVHGTDPGEGLARAQAAAGPFEARRVFRVVPAFSAALTLDQALRVAALPEVRQLEWNAPGKAELETATVFFGADHVVDDLGFDGDRDGDPLMFTRDDVVIAILDTGFDGQHEDLDGGKLIHFLDPDGETEAYDSGNHGTHVASIAAGTGDADAQYRGVAPGAAVVGIKIVETGGPGGGGPLPPVLDFGAADSTLEHAIAAYEWLVENREAWNIRVATMSFGFGIASDGTSALELAVDAAWDAGIVCFKSNGNSGPDRATMTIPAAARGILGMGAMLDPGGQQGRVLGAPGTESLATVYGMALAGFSSRGPTADGRVKPDLAAPGQSITAALAGSGDGYAAFSGTSMASPFGAGVAALMLDANPALTPDEVRDILRSTAEDWGVQGPDVDYGWGRVRAAEAVGEALRRAGIAANATSPVVPYHEVRAGRLADGPALPVPGGLGSGVAERTIEVTDTTHPFAVTAIVEGRLLSLQVLDPAGNLAASFNPPNLVARQHNLGFVAGQPGTYTVRLVGQPGAAFVFDVAHGTAGGLAIAVPALPGEGLEAAGARPAPLGDALALAGLGLAAGVLAARRRRP